jgi:hypothetical protein
MRTKNMKITKKFYICVILFFLIPLNVTVDGDKISEASVAGCEKDTRGCLGNLYTLSPPWDTYETDDDFFGSGDGQHISEWDVDKHEGWVTISTSVSNGKALGIAYFGHLSEWHCPYTGIYKISYYYSYEGSSWVTQYDVTCGNVAYVHCNFNDREHSYQIFGKSGTHSLLFKDSRTWTIQEHAIKGEQYWVGAYCVLFGHAESYAHANVESRIESTGKLTKITLELINEPPTTPTRPVGATSGKIGDPYTYTTTATDPNGHKIRYGWDWNGDKIVDDWTSYFDPKMEIHSEYIWDEKGEFQVRVKAEDEEGLQSEWSDPLLIIMAKNKEFSLHSLFQIFLEFLQDKYPIFLDTYS